MCISIIYHTHNSKQVKCINIALPKYPKLGDQPSLIIDSVQYIVVMPSLAIELNHPSAFGELPEDHLSVEAHILGIVA